MSKPVDQLIRSYKIMWENMTNKYLTEMLEAEYKWQREAARQLLAEREQ